MKSAIEAVNWAASCTRAAGKRRSQLPSITGMRRDRADLRDRGLVSKIVLDRVPFHRRPCWRRTCVPFDTDVCKDYEDDVLLW